MIELDHVTYTYPGATRPALRDISLDLPTGEVVLLVGPSGAGKSTLLRCLNGLVPHFSGGALSGTIRVNGLDPVQATPQVMSRHVGFVFQDPEAQFVMDRVEDEIAFALENAAMPPQEMRVRVEETLDLLDLAPLRDRALKRSPAVNGSGWRLPQRWRCAPQFWCWTSQLRSLTRNPPRMC